MKKAKWENTKVGEVKKETKKRKKYMTKARKIDRAKNVFLASIVLLTVTGLLGYNAIDEHVIASKLDEMKKDGRYIEVGGMNSTDGENLTIKHILEPTVEQVKAEIVKQSKNFDLDENKMLELADCESDFKWDAENDNSTATGVYQFIKSTWANTMSGRKGLSVFDYKANIREAMLDIANGESWRWQECLDITGIEF